MQFVHARTGSFARPDFAPKRVAGQVSADLAPGFEGTVGPRGFMRRGPDLVTWIRHACGR